MPLSVHAIDVAEAVSLASPTLPVTGIWAGKSAIAQSVLEMRILAYSGVQAENEDIDRLRRAPLPRGVSVPASFLRTADDQTVAGFAAMAKAVDEFDIDVESMHSWSVLGSTRFVGRAICAHAMTRHREVGAAGISVHVIPQQSLHSLSGALSVAFGMHGPNFGVGGGPRGAEEAFLTAFSFYDAAVCPGMWLVLTGWDPEPIPDAQGRNTIASRCSALALALAPGVPGAAGFRLGVALRRGSSSVRAGVPPDVASLSQLFQHPGSLPHGKHWSWDLGSGFELTLRSPPVS